MKESDGTAVKFQPERMREPLNAYRISEGRYGVARATENRRYIITCGLAYCKSVTFSHEPSQTGLMSHIARIRSMDAVIRGFTLNFPIPVSESVVTVSVGDAQANDDISETDLRFWPTVDTIVMALKQYKPRKILIDDRFGKKVRGMALDLATGNVQEIDNTFGWTWSTLHDVSLNRWISDNDG